MKKILSLAILSMLSLAISVPAFAGEIVEEPEDASSANVQPEAQDSDAGSDDEAETDATNLDRLGVCCRKDRHRKGGFVIIID